MSYLQIPMRLVAGMFLAAVCLSPQPATAALSKCVTDCLNRINTCTARCTTDLCRTNCKSLCNSFSDCGDPSLDFTGITPNVTRRNAHLALVTGHVQCPAGEAFEVRVTLSQRYGAVAFGSSQGACTGDQAAFMIQVHTQFGTALIDAPVEVCALGLLVGDDGVADAKQWCQDGALVSGGDRP